ncbi:MAG: hypothetical protein ACFFBD_01425 [Candidatus Hodarchaeota archaeon]
MKVYIVDSSGTPQIARVSVYEELENDEVYMIVVEALKKIFIWKGKTAPAAKMFLTSRVTSEMRANLFDTYKTIPMDQGNEEKEFLGLFKGRMELTELERSKIKFQKVREEAARRASKVAEQRASEEVSWRVKEEVERRDRDVMERRAKVKVKQQVKEETPTIRKISKPSAKSFTTEAEAIGKEKLILAAVIDHYIENISFKKISAMYGISFNEFKQYLQNHGYPMQRTADLDEIKAKVAQRRKVLKERERKEPAPVTLGNLKQMLFIPSWSRLIGSEFAGFYLNQPVLEIIQDSVVMLPDLVLASLENTLGESFMLLIGPGVYYTKFRLSPGEIITDYRELTGIVLLLDVYEKAQDSSGSTLDSTKLLMTEYLISIPFSLILARQTTQMYLRGVIARNVVHPYKECFDKLLEVCRDPDSLNENEGLKILSAGLSTKIPLYTNELLTEKPIVRQNYSSLTAGIKNVQPKLDKILADLQIESMKAQIFQSIKQLKRDFVEIGHPGLLDWVP